MTPKELIDARLRGNSVDDIYEAVRDGKEISSNPAEEFLNSMAEEVKLFYPKLRVAIKSEDREEVLRLTKGLQDSLQMIEDSCNEQSI